MAINETINYKNYAIVHQVIEADHGQQVHRVHRYTVYRPNNGGKIGQTDNLPAAQKLVDDDLKGQTS